MDHWLSHEEGRSYMPAQQLDGSCYWVPDDLFHQIVEHSIKQLVRAGFKIIVAHGHGPSTRHVINHWQLQEGIPVSMPVQNRGKGLLNSNWNA
ncbi:MAG: hypothetical protein KAR16_13845 [Bacteroidales bacterium]|nr:hypothetical protein [Bacteroidales bacterium]